MPPLRSIRFGSQALSVIKWGKRYLAVCRAGLRVRRKMGSLACEDRSVTEVERGLGVACGDTWRGSLEQ